MSAGILLLGDRGMLGRAFRELLAARQRPFTGFDLPGLDIAEPGQVGPLFAKPWSTVINCAAYTNVDGAETDEMAALRANGTAPGVLAAAGNDIQSRTFASSRLNFSSAWAHAAR